MENLLTSESDLEVIRGETGGEAKLVRTIERYQPDFVLLDECSSGKEDNLPFRLLSAYPDLRVIMVGTIENRVRLYHRREIEITRASDLANLIRSY
jgi:chemotaxis response regulator CheB